MEPVGLPRGRNRSDVIVFVQRVDEMTEKVQICALQLAADIDDVIISTQRVAPQLKQEGVASTNQHSTLAREKLFHFTHFLQKLDLL